MIQFEDIVYKYNLMNELWNKQIKAQIMQKSMNY